MTVQPGVKLEENGTEVSGPVSKSVLSDEKGASTDSRNPFG